MKKIISWTVYVVFVCAFIFGALEWALRSTYFAPTYQQYGINIILDEEVLYKVKPYSNLDINNYGFRGINFSKSRNDKKRILVLGDSFMMGLNVKSDQTMPAVLEQRLGKKYEVYNMGILGYGPDQSLVQLQTLGKDFKPDMVILSVFPANDFGDFIRNELFNIDAHGELQRNPDNLVKQALPFSRIQYFLEWRLDKEGENNEAIKHLFKRFFWDAFNFDLMDDANSAMAQKMVLTMRLVLRTFKQELEREGIKFGVVIIPNSANMQDPNIFVSQNVPRNKYFVNEDAIATICQEESIRYVNVHEHVKSQSLPAPLFVVGDGHLSVEGNSLVADIVASKLIDQ